MTDNSDEVVKALETYGRRIGHSIIPIFRREEGGGGWEHVGSAFVLRINKQWFAVTAAHTLEGERQYAVWGPSGWANIDLSICVPPLAAVPENIDVVFIPLTPEVRERCSLTDAINDVVMVGYPDKTAPSYIMMGHPISRTKLRDAQTWITTQCAVVTGAAIAGFEAKDFDADLHAAITYDVKTYRLPSGRPTEVPQPVGMSGGPLLYAGFTNEKSAITFQLAGVLTRYNKKLKVLIGTRWTAILDRSTRP